MKTTFVLTIALFVSAQMGLAAQKSETFSGELMDSACAKTGSHATMMKSNAGLTAKDCTLACMQHGAKIVLYDAANKKVYQLDDQKKPQQFAGEKVKITGTLDAITNTIHVSSIAINT